MQLLDVLQQSLGVDFGVPPKVIEPQVLAEFELLQRQTASFSPVSESAAERCRLELAATAREFSTTKPDLRAFSLRRGHLKVMRELRTNPDIVITRPDKVGPLSFSRVKPMSVR